MERGQGRTGIAPLGSPREPACELIGKALSRGGGGCAELTCFVRVSEVTEIV